MRPLVMSFSLEWERDHIQPSSHRKNLKSFPVPTQWLDATEAIMFSIDCPIQAPHSKLEAMISHCLNPMVGFISIFKEI